MEEAGRVEKGGHGSTLTLYGYGIVSQEKQEDKFVSDDLFYNKLSVRVFILPRRIGALQSFFFLLFFCVAVSSLS